jgi:hypothetical protein
VAINKKRKHRIADVLKCLEIMVDLMGGDEISSCSFQCDALLLGALIIEMGAAKLLSPPLAPFEGMSLHGIRDAVRKFRPISFHSRLTNAHITCNLAELRNGILSNHQGEYHLDLKTFLVCKKL